MTAGPPPTWQFACAAYIPLLTANLSVLGSGLIIYSVLLGPGRRTRLRKPHHRMLLAMSIYDLLYSTAKAWTFLLAPTGYGVPGARGNMATCRMQGFFIEICHATGAYNALLSVYFWLSIVRGVEPSTFARYEPLAHVLIFVIFVGFASVGVAIKLFNPAFGFCFIASYPPGCESGPGAPPCDRFPPQTMGLLYEIFAQMWIQAYIVIVTIANVAIWYHVHRQQAIIRQYSQKKMGGTGTASGTASNNDNGASTSRKRKSNSRERMVAVQSTLYVAAFISCWIGPTAFHLAGWIGNFQSFWAMLVIVIFTPLQGLWNAVIFARPIYLRIRRRDPGVGRIRAARMVFFDPEPATTTSASGGAAANGRSRLGNSFVVTSNRSSVRTITQNVGAPDKIRGDEDLELAENQDTDIGYASNDFADFFTDDDVDNARDGAVVSFEDLLPVEGGEEDHANTLISSDSRNTGIGVGVAREGTGGEQAEQRASWTAAPDRSRRKSSILRWQSTARTSSL